MIARGSRKARSILTTGQNFSLVELRVGHDLGARREGAALMYSAAHLGPRGGVGLARFTEDGSKLRHAVLA